MKATEQNAIEIMKRGGAILASEWTTGRGNYISKRPIPSHCKEIFADECVSLRGQIGKSARRLYKAHPRAKKMIIVDNVRAVNKLVAMQAVSYSEITPKVAK